MCPVEVTELIYEVTVQEGPTNEVVVTTPGPQGGQGPSGTLTIGDVDTVAPGDPATVTNVGTPQAAILDFEIPQGETGDTGPAGTIAIGTVTDLPYGDPPTVTNVGTPQAAVLDFEIPAGPQGVQGIQGIPGEGFETRGPFSVAAGDDEDLTGEIWDSSVHNMVDYVAKVKRGTATFVRVEFTIFFHDGGWLLVPGGERYDDALDEAEVDFTVDPTSGQINAENTGSGSVAIHVQSNPWAI